MPAVFFKKKKTFQNRIHCVYFCCSKHFDSLFLSLKSLWKIKVQCIGNVYLYIDKNDFLTDTQVKLLKKLKFPLIVRKCNAIAHFGEQAILTEVESFLELGGEIAPEDYIAKIDSDILFVSGRIFGEVLESGKDAVGQPARYWEPYIYFQGGCYFLRASLLPKFRDFDIRIAHEALAAVNNEAVRKRKYVFCKVYFEDAVIFYFITMKLNSSVLFKDFYGSRIAMLTNRKCSVIHFERERDEMVKFGIWKYVLSRAFLRVSRVGTKFLRKVRGVLRRMGLGRAWYAYRFHQSVFLQDAKEYCYYPIRLLRLRRIDSAHIPKDPSEIRMFIAVRNEAHRLPFLLREYAARGVDRFFVVDNASMDGTIPFLLSQPNTHVFITKERFGHSLCGQEWMNILLQRYGMGHWCIMGDADESFIYPEYEKVGLKQLAAYLDERGADVVNAPLLDMYANVPVRMSVVEPGQAPLSVLRFFDPSSIERTGPPDLRKGGAVYCIDGARKRVLGVSVCLNKAPFIKYHRGVKFLLGDHWLRGGTPADIEGVTLHFKLTSDFNVRVFEEAAREEHWLKAAEYKEYAQKLREAPDITFYYSGSVEFSGSRQLVEMGLMRTSERFTRFAQHL